MTVLQVLSWALPLAPTPPPYNPNAVTPTWVGFVATFLVAGVTILLMIDLTRRVRRARYRGEVREKLEAERLAAEAEDLANGEDPTEH
jgi:hypothetical protein